MAAERDFSFLGVKKTSSGDDTAYRGRCIRSVASSAAVPLHAQLVAGTSWLFADDRFDYHFDHLIIDEAGQVALANVVAMGASACNIVFVGDELQLGQPVKGVHPGTSSISELDFLLEGQATVAPNRGIFLSETRRLHPSICSSISTAFYDGRLVASADNIRRRILFDAPVRGIELEGIQFLR
jgi:superfamily I DNA and/or RNA helicase